MGTLYSNSHVVAGPDWQLSIPTKYIAAVAIGRRPKVARAGEAAFGSEYHAAGAGKASESKTFLSSMLLANLPRIPV